MDTTTAAEPDYSLKDLRINSYGKLPKQSDAIENSIFALMRHAHRLGVRTAKAQSSMTALATERDALRDALSGLLKRHTALVESGDCGNWDCETEDEVIAARAALKEPT